MLPLPFYLVRVLDLTAGVAGAYATRYFADFGAEVVKVESTQQRPDTLREDRTFWDSVNRNKLSVAFDLGSDEGRDLTLQLAAISDIVVIDDASSIAYQALEAACSDLIVVSLAGDGADRAETGIAAGCATIAGLFHRRVTGEGQLIELKSEEVESVLRLSAAATPALLEVDRLGDEAHLGGRGFFEAVVQQDGSVVEMDGVPYRLSRTPAHIRLPAPLLGEHNDYVLGHLLGLDAKNIAALKAKRVVGGGSVSAE